MCVGHRNETPRTGRLRRRQIIFSQLWRPEAQDRGAGRLASSEAALRGLQMAAFSLRPRVAFLCVRASLASLWVSDFPLPAALD